MGGGSATGKPFQKHSCSFVIFVVQETSSPSCLRIPTRLSSAADATPALSRSRFIASCVRADGKHTKTNY